MIRRKNEMVVEDVERLREGEGFVHMTKLINVPEELCGKGRAFTRSILNPGCSIGYHVHETDSELYYILKGTAEYNNNGVPVTVTEGDLTICEPGTGHGLANRGTEPVEFIALIVYA